MESGNIGKRIRDVREEKGLTLRELSDKTGLTLNGISRVELGRTQPTAATVMALARGLEVEPGDLFPKADAPLYPSASEKQRREFLKVLERYAQRRAADFEQALNDPDSGHFADATRATLWLEMVQGEAKTWADWAIEEGPTLLPGGGEDLGEAVRDAFRILGHLLTINAITRKAHRRIEAMPDKPDELEARRLRRKQQEAQESQKRLRDLWDVA